MNLVVQGPGFAAARARELARLCGATSCDAVADSAFRLRGASDEQAVKAWCERHGLDWAWVPDGRRFAGLKLLAMDMDSTLIRIECIDELGAIAGRGAEIAAITASAMRGEIDYPESLRRRVALLAGLEAAALQRVFDERLRLSPGAETLIARCKRDGVKLLLVSGGFSFFADRLKERLGFDFTVSNDLEIARGRLTGKLSGSLVDGVGKKTKFLETLEELNSPREKSVAIGDGANDLPMMMEAGYSVAYRAKPAVQAKADCAINRCGLDAVANLFE